MMELPRNTGVTNDVINLDTDSDSATFAISKLVMDIRRGTPVIHFPSRQFSDLDTRGTLCNYRYQGQATLNYGTNVFARADTETELRDVARGILTQRGYAVAGDPKDLFGQEASISSAEFQVGIRIFEIKGNICQSHSVWNGVALGEFSGEIYLNVEWILYSSLLRQEIVRFTTDGYKFETKPRKDGIALLIREAFADAAGGFASDQRAMDVALRRTAGDRLDRTSDMQEMRLAGSRSYEYDLQQHIGEVLSSVVTIRTGSGHGSGFLVSQDGHVLTNAHVVGDSTEVAVIFSNGIEANGKVYRSNKKRDTALILLSLRVESPLPINLESTKPLDTVVAVGSPWEEALDSTLTRGIVSALRRDPVSGLNFIQTDVAISPGSSGGPLLDSRGNVVGMSVSKFVAPGVDGISFFIPIKEVLKSLSIVVVPDGGS